MWSTQEGGKEGGREKEGREEGEGRRGKGGREGGEGRGKDRREGGMACPAGQPANRITLIISEEEANQSHM